MDERLRDVARRAAGPTTRRGPDLDVVTGRVRRRRLVRGIGGGVASVVLLVVVALNVRVGAPAGVDVVDVGLDSTGLRTVDYDDPFLPTLLPDGYDLCAPTQQVGPPGMSEPNSPPDRSQDRGADDSRNVVATTVFCSADGGLTLMTGGHDALPEVGERFAMGPRTGYAEALDGNRRLQVTVSDATRDDDTHYRLASTDPSVRRGNLAAIIASIPAYADEVSVPGIGR